MSHPATSGIQTAADGQSFIPSSRRADGSTRKEIKVRPGYRPPEDVAKYKSRNVEDWQTQGSGVPGADEASIAQNDIDTKSKNAKRREAARRKKESENQQLVEGLEGAIAGLHVVETSKVGLPANGVDTGAELGKDVERQKKIRNQLKKLKAVRDLKSRKTAGEKLSAEQLVKIAKEHEIVRDLTKLDYNGPELDHVAESTPTQAQPD